MVYVYTEGDDEAFGVVLADQDYPQDEGHFVVLAIYRDEAQANALAQTIANLLRSGGAPVQLH